MEQHLLVYSINGTNHYSHLLTEEHLEERTWQTILLRKTIAAHQQENTSQVLLPFEKVCIIYQKGEQIMEEKEITWQQIDAELETIMNEFADMLIIIDKKVKTLKEKMNNVKKPSEEDLFLAILCKGIIKELDNITSAIPGLEDGYQHGKKDVFKLLKKQLGI